MSGIVTASQSGGVAGEGVKRPHDAEEQTKGEGSSKKYRQDLASLPTRQYLDQTVVPILLQVINYHFCETDRLNMNKHQHVGLDI